MLGLRDWTETARDEQGRIILEKGKRKLIEHNELSDFIYREVGISSRPRGDGSRAAKHYLIIQELGGVRKLGADRKFAGATDLKATIRVAVGNPHFYEDELINADRARAPVLGLKNINEIESPDPDVQIVVPVGIYRIASAIQRFSYIG